jgi:hypothetical protein
LNLLETVMLSAGPTSDEMIVRILCTDIVSQLQRKRMRKQTVRCTAVLCHGCVRFGTPTIYLRNVGDAVAVDILVLFSSDPDEVFHEGKFLSRKRDFHKVKDTGMTL